MLTKLTRRPLILVDGFDYVRDVLADLAHGGVHVLDELVLFLREGLNAFGLLRERLDQRVLSRRDAVHPPEAHWPANGVDDGKPKHYLSVHALFCSSGRIALAANRQPSFGSPLDRRSGRADY